ncbi:ATP-grasp domain-containing protein [Sinorhizobium meliloti]|nr:MULTISPECIES: ATP-grasp domain-containing protein [Sinorhizobium]ARS66196.1 pyridoxal-phosphate dependent enzyme [Sinorhizobium meliloti RU11/001]MDE3765472.1 ATP-grasp domain-containing protein [Sinorhizobium meliloti]MDE3779234.1 ATP-grasp domain-containing protein [Sinorhizobium meliloti]MDE3804809.1 ATP-grasp domain-containing protein [Sinorhizobium meliloti]RVG60115.1 ATP-grasp domain-containing protein [Sinorhizobium meliloti]
MKREIIFVEASTTGAGSRAQQLAHAEGLNVTLLTRDRGRYGADVLSSADNIFFCDTNKHAEVVRSVRQRGLNSSIAAVTTTADMYVPQAALAAQEMSLPGLRYEAALRARNKHLMRLVLAERAPEHNVPFSLALNPDEAVAAAQQLKYPLVVKPQEENDGVGVRLIHNESQLTDYMATARSFTRNSAGQGSPPGILMEAYIAGTEFSVETIQFCAGPCQVIGVTTKEMTGLKRNHFIEAGHSFPYVGPEAAALAAATCRVLNALDICHGAVHTECRVDGEDIRIMEINPRLAGGKIGSHLIEMATGLSAVQAVLDAALGKTLEWRCAESKGAAIHFIWTERPGVFRGIKNTAQLLAMPGIVSVAPIAKFGAHVRPPTSNGDHVAEILAVGQTATTANARAKAAHASARLILD